MDDSRLVQAEGLIEEARRVLAVVQEETTVTQWEALTLISARQSLAKALTAVIRLQREGPGAA